MAELGPQRRDPPGAHRASVHRPPRCRRSYERPPPPASRSRPSAPATRSPRSPRPTASCCALDRMNRIISSDPATGRVRVQAGISLHELNPKLKAIGLALPNLGDVDPQSVAGAVSTGTHGTGDKLHRHLQDRRRRAARHRRRRGARDRRVARLVRRLARHARRARHPDRGHAAVRTRLPAARPRGADGAARGARRHRRAGRRQRPLRVLLVPAHREGA